MANKPVADSRRGTQARLGALREPGRAGIISLAAALVPVLLICLLATPIYPMSPDEQVQQLYASGRFLGAGQQLLMPYSLVTFSAPISALYALLPAVPWYALALLGLIVASFAVAWDKTLRSRMSGRLCVPTLALLVALEVISTLYLTYTIVAFLAVGAGLMLVLGRAAFDSPGGAHATDVAGMALVVAGYSLRPESGLAAIAVFAPFAVWVLVRNRNAGSIARGVIVVALVGVCAFAGRFAYDHTSGWEGYSAYLDAGRSALDYPDLPTEAVQAVEPALSDNDVDVLYNWLFADDGVFGTEFFERWGSAWTISGSPTSRARSGPRRPTCSWASWRLWASTPGRSCATWARGGARLPRVSSSCCSRAAACSSCAHVCACTWSSRSWRWACSRSCRSPAAPRGPWAGTRRRPRPVPPRRARFPLLQPASSLRLR